MPVMTKKMRHIAFFLHDLEGRGAHTRVVALANEFAAQGHQIDLLVVRPEGPLKDQILPRVRLVPVGGARTYLPWVRKRRKRQTIAATPDIARYLKRERPDIIMSGGNHVNAATALAHRRAGVREIGLVLRASTHLSGAEHRPRLARWLTTAAARRLYPDADAIVAVSNSVAHDLASLVPLPPDRLITIPNPVIGPDFEAKRRQPCDLPWFAPGEPPVILGAGKLVPQKDFATLLRAFALLRARRRARLVILGDGPERSGLEALAAQLGVAADIALPGFVENPFPCMAAASVFVLSSAWEGLPGVLIEAMACGCPVVSTDCPGGSREILLDGALGPLTPVGHAEQLADAIEHVLDAPPARTALQARVAAFAVPRAADQYLAAFQRTIAARHGRIDTTPHPLDRATTPS